MTICTHQRLCLFNDMRLRRIAEEMWRALPRFNPRVKVDEWVVMPNHVHGIIRIEEQTDAETGTFDPIGTRRPWAGLGINVAPGALGTIVRSYKSCVARRANRINDLAVGSLWQRGFWEHVIRDNDEIDATRRYIQDNPRRWAEDRDNLDALLARMDAH